MNADIEEEGRHVFTSSSEVIGSTPQFRATHLFPVVDVTLRRRDDGTLTLDTGPLGPAVPRSLSAALAAQAAALGDRTLIAERDATGEWVHRSYADVKATADRIAGWLSTRAGSDRILIVTGNSTAHAELTFGAAAASVPICPVSAQYAMGSTGAHSRLRHVVDLLRPTIVFAEQVGPISSALRQVLASDVTVICTDPDRWPGAVDWNDVRTHAAVADPDAMIAAVDPQTPLRYMLTSGSTGLPKIVVQTNLMWCTLFTAASSVLAKASGWGVRTLDWMPWSHVSGISVLIGALVNGGTYYIDDGRPTPELFGRTLRNIAEVQPLFFANVPYAFGMLCDALEADAHLRHRFYEHLQLCLYGGAGLSQPVYDRFQAMAEQTIGERIMFTTGYGSTETTAGVMTITWPTTKVGVGLPVPGVETKLIPLDEDRTPLDGSPAARTRYEVRFRSDCVMPGYLDNPAATARSFDEEGYYRSGDALTFIDPDDASQGFAFAGRLAEEFKLSTGTFVPGGQLHADIIAATTPVVLETLICGEGRDEVGALLWLNPAGCASVLGADGPVAELAVDEQVLDWIAQRLGRPQGAVSDHGSAARIARFAILAEPPGNDVGELSDKGSINQSIALGRRRADVDRLYAGGPGVRQLP